MVLTRGGSCGDHETKHFVVVPVPTGHPVGTRSLLRATVLSITVPMPRVTAATSSAGKAQTPPWVCNRGEMLFSYVEFLMRAIVGADENRIIQEIYEVKCPIYLNSS